jgi:hypothetical protein
MNNSAPKFGNRAANRPSRPVLTLLLTALVTLSCVPLAYADRDRDGRDRFEQRDRHDFRPYRSDHWVLDRRFHHNHYYPSPGYSVGMLPPDSLDIRVGRGRLFFSTGVWFRPEGPRYIVVTPPPGAYLPILPPDYATIWLGSTPYYYANGIYYTSAPAGGYVVAPPPPDQQVVTLPPPPPGMAPPPPPVGAPAANPGSEDGLIVYPKNGQSAAQMATDRAECTRWAVNQTGYDPARSAPSDNRRGDFQRAASACLEAHGYTVK